MWRYLQKLCDSCDWATETVEPPVSCDRSSENTTSRRSARQGYDPRSGWVHQFSVVASRSSHKLGGSKQQNFFISPRSSWSQGLESVVTGLHSPWAMGQRVLPWLLPFLMDVGNPDFSQLTATSLQPLPQSSRHLPWVLRKLPHAPCYLVVSKNCSSHVYL